jgi:hypothetical protein
MLLVDATCLPTDTTFPTDPKILNAAREKSKELNNVLHWPHKGVVINPRIYCIKTGLEYLAVAKSKNVSKNKPRKAIRKQRGYLGPNLKTIAKRSQKALFF